jgi:hypothetical protein
VELPNGRDEAVLPMEFPPWYLVAIRQDGRNVVGQRLELSQARLGNLEFLFSDRANEIRGTVRAPNGQIQAGTSVLLFPFESRLWTDFGPMPLKLRETRTASDGTYQFAQIVPGRYRIVALMSAADRMWTLDDNLSRLAVRTSDVSIDVGAQVVMNLVARR